MQETTISRDPQAALVAVFSSRTTAGSAVRSLDNVGLAFAEISSEPIATNDEQISALQEMFYSTTHLVDSSDVIDGIAKGAAIGAATGLLFVAVPVVGLVAPLGGALGGALIGGMAGIDESMREAKLPDLENYRQMLGAGKGLVVIPGDESFRCKVENELRILGAEEVYQHPPVGHAFRRTDVVNKDIEELTV